MKKILAAFSLIVMALWLLLGARVALCFVATAFIGLTAFAVWCVVSLAKGPPT